MFNHRLQTITSSSSVSLDQVKKHLIVEHDDDDTLIAEYINSAIRFAEARTELSLRVQKYQTYGYNWPCGNVRLEYGPVRQIESVSYLDPDLVEQQIASDKFGVYDNAGEVVLEFHERPPCVYCRRRNAVQITYLAGYGQLDVSASNQYGLPYTLPFVLGLTQAVTQDEADNLPEHIRQAIYMLVGHWYENRESVVVGTINAEVQIAAESLLHTARIMGV